MILNFDLNRVIEVNQRKMINVIQKKLKVLARFLCSTVRPTLETLSFVHTKRMVLKNHSTLNSFGNHNGRKVMAH